MTINKIFKGLAFFALLLFAFQISVYAESSFKDSSALTGGTLLPSEREELAKQSLEDRKDKFTVTDTNDLIARTRPISSEETVLLYKAAKKLRDRRLHEESQELERVLGKLSTM